MTSDILGPFLDGRSRRARFGVRPRAARVLPHVEGLLAGAAEVDITPPPGMPKAGYSANAHDGTGFRTRLRARVIHLRRGSSSFAWIMCDLLGGSPVVTHLVADAVADDTDIGIAGLMMGATHTHAAVGQFCGCDFYNRFASNRPGFDPAWTAFLVERIAGAVRMAHDTRRPARAAFGTADVWGRTRNRSLDPHVHNTTVHDERTEPQRKFVAVNPQLHLLRVDALDGDTAPIAAGVVFSVHGTAVPQRAREYNADIWAYLTNELAQRIEAAAGHRPIVGAVEGTHADVAPAIRPGQAGHLEAARLGRGIGAEAATLWRRLEGELHDDLALATALREVDLDLPENRTADGVTIPNRPAVGAALLAGAHENVTPIIHRVPPFRAGSPRRHIDADQGPKAVVGTRWLQPLVLPLRSFPRVLPVQVVRLGDRVLVGLPFEVTVESGRRIAAAAHDAAIDSGVAQAVVCSVTNDYWGYVTSAEEYDRQFYEGGHTLYGPRTQEYLARQVARLTRRLLVDGNVSEPVPQRRWDMRVHRYLVEPVRESRAPRSLGRAVYHDATARSDGAWEWRWTDATPAALTWHESLVTVQQRDDDGPWLPAVHHGAAVDDQGCELEIEYLGAHGDGHSYAVRWHDPDLRAGRAHRFVLVGAGGSARLHSEPFD